eukprot:scaffold8270_cov130-Amphora_coffeaeformis.AAC.1
MACPHGTGPLYYTIPHFRSILGARFVTERSDAISLLWALHTPYTPYYNTPYHHQRTQLVCSTKHTHTHTHKAITQPQLQPQPRWEIQSNNSNNKNATKRMHSDKRSIVIFIHVEKNWQRTT